MKTNDLGSVAPPAEKAGTPMGQDNISLPRGIWTTRLGQHSFVELLDGDKNVIDDSFHDFEAAGKVADAHNETLARRAEPQPEAVARVAQLMNLSDADARDFLNEAQATMKRCSQPQPEAGELVELHDELHKMIQCSMFGWPNTDELSKAHQLLYRIRKLSQPQPEAVTATEQQPFAKFTIPPQPEATAGQTEFWDMAVGVLTDVGQLLDGWHSDGTAWSEWDEKVRLRVSDLLRLCIARSSHPLQSRAVRQEGKTKL